MIFEHEMWVKDTKNKGNILFARVHPRKSHRISLETFKKSVADWEYRASRAKTRYKQMPHLIKKFGGILNFCIAVNKHPNYVLYHWLGVPRSGNITEKTGLLNMGYVVRLVQAARHFGVLLTPEDLFPDLIEKGVVKNPYTSPELKRWWTVMEPDTSMQRLETQIAELLEA